MGAGNVDLDDDGKDTGPRGAGDEQGSPTQGGQADDKNSADASRFLTIVLLALVLVCLLLAAAGLYFLRPGRSVETSSIVSSKFKSATKITRPVPQLDSREMLDFLIVYKVRDGEVITAFRMEAVFQSLSKYADFKKNCVSFRNAVYDFLLRQDAAGNSRQSWHSVLGKNLLDYLKVKLPESCPDSIRLTQIETR